VIARTSAQDVLDLFRVTGTAKATYQDWLSDVDKQGVIPHVMTHESAVIYRLAPGDVEQVCRSTKHALGEVKRDVAESVKEVVDWHPSFAFMHVLHYAVETMGILPTWQVFLSFVREDSKGYAMLWGPAQELIDRLSGQPGGPSRSVVDDSVHWRVGNAYYSFLRELYVVTHLRALGLDVRMHPLADALFRVDFWCGRTVCSLLVKNAKFHKDGQGRKRSVEEFLKGATPPFRFHKIQLERASKFGVVHLPSAQHIRRAADQLRATLT
jgi:hypothetical protein